MTAHLLVLLRTIKMGNEDANTTVAEIMNKLIGSHIK